MPCLSLLISWNVNRAWKRRVFVHCAVQHHVQVPVLAPNELVPILFQLQYLSIVLAVIISNDCSLLETTVHYEIIIQLHYYHYTIIYVFY